MNIEFKLDIAFLNRLSREFGSFVEIAENKKTLDRQCDVFCQFG